MKKNLSPHILPARRFMAALLPLLLMLFVPLGCADDDEAESGRATVKMILLRGPAHKPMDRQHSPIGSA